MHRSTRLRRLVVALLVVLVLAVAARFARARASEAARGATPRGAVPCVPDARLATSISLAGAMFLLPEGAA